MLKKLIKHEWRSTAKICYILFLVLAGVALLAAFGISLPLNYMARNASNYGDMNEAATAVCTMLMVFSVAVFMVSLTGVVYALFIYQGVRFYRTMFTDEGYLTHTLPATPNQILFSKLLVAGCWNILVVLGVLVAIILIGLSVVLALYGTSWQINFASIFEVIKEIIRAIIEADQPLVVLHVIAAYILCIFVGMFSGVSLIFCGLSLGQLFKSYKGIMGIICYMGLAFVQSLVAQFIAFFVSIGSAFSGMMYANPAIQMTSSLDCAVVVGIISAGFSYWLSHYLISKKLNLN